MVAHTCTPSSQEDGEFKCSLSNAVRPSQNAHIGVEKMAQSVKCLMCKHDTQVQILSTHVKCWFWYMPVLLPLGRWKQRTLELTSHLVLLNWWVPGLVRDLISKERVERKEKSTCTSGLCVCPCTLDTKNILIGKLWWLLRDILSKHTGFPKHLGQITNMN